jgi:hypothetical protein
MAHARALAGVPWTILRDMRVCMHSARIAVMVEHNSLYY